MRELGYYDGSRLLQPIASSLGLGIDQLNFVVCQLVGLLLGFPYRTFFGPDKCDVRTRHVLQIAFGLPLAYFCFGRDFSLILLYVQGHLLSVSCYVLMRILKPPAVERAVFAVVMGYMCLAHLYRQYYDYGGYVLDITGPLMVNTQRLTGLVFSYSDGQRLKKEESSLSSFVKSHAIRELPSVLQFFSYVFSFHMLLVGPFAFFDDYCKFIDGSNITSYSHNGVANGAVDTTSNPSKVLPSPWYKVLEKLCAAVFFGFVMLVVLPKYDVFFLLEPEFAEYSFPMKVFYVLISTTLTRSKYYLAWKLAEALNVNAGLAFNGYDESGKPKWDLIDNVNIIKLEIFVLFLLFIKFNAISPGCGVSASLNLLLLCGNSMKSVFDHWNIGSSRWLRYVVYERLRSTLFVFMLSAFWHGFYPGYYLTFFSGAMCVTVGRILRRNLRPYFQRTEVLARLYDVITTVASRLCLSYVAFPFVLLEIGSSILIYSQIYFWIHVCLAVIFLCSMLGLCPAKSQGPPKPSTNQVSPNKSDVQSNGTRL